MSARTLLIAIMLLWASAQPAGAASIEPVGFDQLTESAYGLSLIGFETVGDKAREEYPEGNAAFDGVAFSGSGRLFVTDPSYFPYLNQWGTGDVLSDEGADGLIGIELSSGISAFGVDLMTYSVKTTGKANKLQHQASDIEVTVKTEDQGQYSFTVSTKKSNRPTFVGVLSDQEILSITLDALSSSYLFIDNFSFGSYTAVTEPLPTGGYIGTGQGQEGTFDPAGVDEPAVPALLLLGLAALRRIARSGGNAAPAGHCAVR